MNNFIAYLDARPIATGMFGAATGFLTAFLHYLKILGDIAAPLTILFGCVAAFFSMLLVVFKFLNRHKEK